MTSIAPERAEVAGALRWWSTPAVLWGALGAAAAALALVVLGQWLAAGIHSIGSGATPISMERIVAVRILEWGSFAALLALLGWFVVRPLARRQQLSFDGLFILAVLALNFWDPLDNYLVFAFQYNAHFLNVGSWAGFIPGWQSASGEAWAVPVAFVFGAYTWAFFLAARMGCAIVDRLARVRPSWGAARRYEVVFVASALLAAISELAFLQTHAIANIRPLKALTLWNGHYYGWPLYNPILFGATWTAITALRSSRDSRGLSFVERGLERLPIGAHEKTLVRFFAISAYVQVAYILLYFVPFNLLALGHGATPALPSYFPVPR